MASLVRVDVVHLELRRLRRVAHEELLHAQHERVVAPEEDPYFDGVGRSWSVTRVAGDSGTACRASSPAPVVAGADHVHDDCDECSRDEADQRRNLAAVERRLALTPTSMRRRRALR